MFISQQKTNLIPRFFTDIIQFKESYNLGQKPFEQKLLNRNSAGHVVCDGETRITSTFHFRLFLGKKWQFFLKMQTFFALFLGPFYPNLGENESSIKFGLSLFSINSPFSSCKKSQKTNEPIFRKTLNKRTNKHRWN